MEQIINSNDISKQIIDNNHRWYSLSVVSGQEHLVVENVKSINLVPTGIDQILLTQSFQLDY